MSNLSDLHNIVRPLSDFDRKQLNKDERLQTLEHHVNQIGQMPLGHNGLIDFSGVELAEVHRKGLILPNHPDFFGMEPTTQALLGALRERGFDIGHAELVNYLNARKKKSGQRKPIQVRSVEETIGILKGLFSTVPPYRADDQSVMPFGTMNLEFFDAKKAAEQGEALAWLLKNYFAALTVQETNPDGMKPVAEMAGYSWMCGTPNERGQACGIFWDPNRFEEKDRIVIDEVVGVDGVEQLRASVAAILQDKYWGMIFRLVSDHLKSMRGGPWKTGIVRFHQTLKLVHHLMRFAEGETPIPTIALGDWNCFLDKIVNGKATDVEPFLYYGWTMLNQNDNQSTQRMGGRLDGGFVNYMPEGISFSSYRVIPVFKEAPWFTDHAAVYWRMQRAA
jgi:hypothetical protein